jgi:6-pyruvoyl tetrahydropterin synthase-like protein
LEINCVLCGKFDVEKHVTPIIEPYQGAYMNEIDEFRNANPTLENISEFFRDKIETKLEEKKLLFHSIEIAEKSTISYIC